MWSRPTVTRTLAYRRESSVTELDQTAIALVSQGKGILAADETVSTLTKRFDMLAIESTPTSRRDYRELMITTAGAAEYISGVILYDETIRQPTRPVCRSSRSAPTRDHPRHQGRQGRQATGRFPGESITEGLDGLRERLDEYAALGARFAKWRAVFTDRRGHARRTAASRRTPHALARYAALCQERASCRSSSRRC